MQPAIAASWIFSLSCGPPTLAAVGRGPLAFATWRLVSVLPPPWLPGRPFPLRWCGPLCSACRSRQLQPVESQIGLVQRSGI